MQQITHLLRIRVLSEKVFEAISTETGVQGWWTQEAQMPSPDKLITTFTGQYKSEYKVETKRDEEVVWRITEDDSDTWINTKVTFTLEKEDPNTTVLRLSHTNWPADADEEMLANINYNWGRFLYSLKTYCETGKGFPVKKA